MGKFLFGSLVGCVLVSCVVGTSMAGENLLTNGDFENGMNGWLTWSDAKEVDDEIAPEMYVDGGVATVSRDVQNCEDWKTGVIYQLVDVPAGTRVKVGGQWAGNQNALASNADMWWAEVVVCSIPDQVQIPGDASGTWYNFGDEAVLDQIFDYPGYLQKFVGDDTTRGGGYAAGSDIINSFGPTYPTWAMEDIDNSLYDWVSTKAAFGSGWDPEERLEYNFTNVKSYGQVLVGLKYGGEAARGEASFDNITLEVVPTGDANEDGKVDGSDVTILANNWQKGVSTTEEVTWKMGDFNDDGKVDGSDVTILANNWQEGVATTAGVAVPEPGTLLLLLSGLAGLALWRRQR